MILQFLLFIFTSKRFVRQETMRERIECCECPTQWKETKDKFFSILYFKKKNYCFFFNPQSSQLSKFLLTNVNWFCRSRSDICWQVSFHFSLSSGIDLGSGKIYCEFENMKIIIQFCWNKKIKTCIYFLISRKSHDRLFDSRLNYPLGMNNISPIYEDSYW